MLAALRSRQEALEEALQQRLEELRKLCLREAVSGACCTLGSGCGLPPCPRTVTVSASEGGEGAPAATSRRRRGGSRKRVQVGPRGRDPAAAQRAGSPARIVSYGVGTVPSPYDVPSLKAGCAASFLRLWVPSGCFTRILEIILTGGGGIHKETGSHSVQNPASNRSSAVTLLCKAAIQRPLLCLLDSTALC